MGRTVTIRASAETRDALNSLAAAVGISVPQLLEQLAEREHERRILRSGLDALATMDKATRDAYMGEFREWDDAPLAESA